MNPLDTAVLAIIRRGRDRCALGWGKYPLGTRDAVEELLPLVEDHETIERALADFDRRLAE